MLREYFRKFRSLGLDATRSFIAARMMDRRETIDHVRLDWTDDLLECVADGMRRWSDHQCRVFVRNGYRHDNLKAV
jgi:hypothetical protein